MKKGIILSLLFVLCFNCEDVIELDLNEAEPRLVIEASINWFKDTSGNEQAIKLSLSAPFFEDEVPPANNATVRITDANNNSFTFIEDANTGIYRNTNFLPVLDQIYYLEIVYNNQTYRANERLTSVVPIDNNLCDQPHRSVRVIVRQEINREQQCA